MSHNTENTAARGRANDDVEINVDEADFESGTILPRVLELLTRTASEQERQRYERFFGAASVAIERLGEIDVSGSEDEDPDNTEVTFWEKLAPVVTGTLRRVESFLDVVRNQFPITEVEQEAALDEAFDEAFSSFDGGAPGTLATQEPTDSIQETAKTLRSFCSNLTRELRSLQDSLASPSIMQDRWNLLERIGEFRGRARSAIGEMVFVAARLFAVVRKEDVVPFYKEDVDTSLALRGSISALRNRIDVQRTRLERVDAATDDASARTYVKRILDEFHGFTRTNVYRSMRAVDRRTFLEVKRELEKIAKRTLLDSREIRTSLEGLARFLDSLTLMNQRELLLTHDKESIADIERHLNATVDAVVDEKPDVARSSLALALKTGENLFGREPTFDVLLNLFTHARIDTVELPELLAMAHLIRRQL
ncbi:MAG: hypothetical protein A2341_20470 [Deltaproteobacteria bacterium RIFOXYB12_FULL_58_9]|nr:MAG: hypothetical protein A2341_20470 [Deltaproteobacteria bacterium RIFOXYB12_FULL_58_9]